MTQHPVYHSPDNLRVLVVLMNDARDWEIAQTEGWYRIPVNRAPRQIGAEYLAFYFTQAFSDLAWAVHHIAPVLHYNVLTRCELLPDEPDHPRAGDWYYQIEIGPIESLPRPIPSLRLRRLTFLPTTMGRLLAAEEINDLWMREPLEERLWNALKGAGLRPEGLLEIREGEVSYEVPIAIPCAQGGVSVGAAEEVSLPPGWTHVSTKSGDWAGLIAKLQREVNRRGGLL